MRATLFALAVIATALLPERALAEDPPSVGILSLEITGSGAPELRTLLVRSLRGGLAATGSAVTDQATIDDRLSSDPNLLRCFSTTCLETIGERVGVDLFVRVVVEAQGADYDVEIFLLDPKAEGGVLRSKRDTCSVCTIGEVNDLVSAAAADLLAGTGRIAITASPVGAIISIDGAEVGSDRFEGDLEAGDHIVTARLAGHVPMEKTVTINAGQDPVEVSLELPSADAGRGADLSAAGPESQDERPFRTWKWAAAGAAATSIAVGSIYLAIDDNPTCGGSDTRQCPRLRDTGGLGVAFLLLGVASGGAAGYMFWRDHQEMRASGPLVGAGVDDSGAEVRALWRF